MRRSWYNAIKKTEQWYKYKGSEDSVQLNYTGDEELIHRMRLLGKTYPGDGGVISGIGDSNGNGGYSLEVHCHGKNLFSGIDLMSTLKKVNVTSYETSVENNRFSIQFESKYNGKVIFDRRNIKFKENTVYTVAGYFSYTSSTTTANGRKLQMRFNYTDGTYTEMKYKSTAKNVYAYVASTEGKTISNITAYVTKEERIQIGIPEFGIFEGTLPNYTKGFVDYDGNRLTVNLDAPLLGHDSAYDEVDLLGGVIYRRLARLRITDELDIFACDEEGVFGARLPAPMMVGRKYICTIPRAEGDDLSCENNASVESYDGEYIYFRLEEIYDIDTFIEYLSTNVVELAYVLASPYEEKIDFNLALPDVENLHIDINSSNVPKKIYCIHK